MRHQTRDGSVRSTSRQRPRHLAPLGWGKQLDVRIVRDGNRTDDPDGPLIPGQVAGYLAKYATKDANSLRHNDPGPNSSGPASAPRPHVVRMRKTCENLARRARRHDPETPYLLLGKWAHMLGFRGHFSSKSRAYSITLGRLRQARHRFQRLAAEARRTGDALDVRDIEDRLLAEAVGWAAAVRKIGRPTLRVHDLRHTCASLWLGAGADLKVVQRILGHASAAMTMDLYGHLIDHNLWASAQKVGGI